MAKAPTPAEIREAQRIRAMHPADRPVALAKQIVKQVEAPVSQIQERVKQAVAAAGSAENRVKAAEERVKELMAQMEGATTALAVRSRMTPQDLRDALNGLFESYNFSPAEELVLMLKDRSHPHYVTDTKVRVSILSELQSYVMPKLKSTEVKGKVDHEHRITIVRIGADGNMVKEEMNRAIPIEARVERDVGPMKIDAPIAPQLGEGLQEVERG